MATEPGRGGRGAARLLAAGLYLQPVTPPRLHGRRDRRAADTHARRRVVRAARLWRRRASRRYFRCRFRIAEFTPRLHARRRPGERNALSGTGLIAPASATRHKPR